MGNTDSYPNLLELFDVADHSYVPYGTALKPEMIEVEEDEEMLLKVGGHE